MGCSHEDPLLELFVNNLCRRDIQWIVNIEIAHGMNDLGVCSSPGQMLYLEEGGGVYCVHLTHQFAGKL